MASININNLADLRKFIESKPIFDITTLRYPNLVNITLGNKAENYFLQLDMTAGYAPRVSICKRLDISKMGGDNYDVYGEKTFYMNNAGKKGLLKTIYS